MFTRSLVLASLLLTISAYGQIDSAQLQQWRNQKYSMFIHFGAIYSQLGGVWDGREISKGLSEQIQAHAGIYSDTYADVAKTFNPAKWSPDSIALLAKNAGMRSIVITSKHHDGFAMFNTATTGFNVVDATPYHKDILKEVAEACARHGLRFGIYFSLIDWHYPAAMPISSHNSDSITAQHHEYNKQQITELLSNYGPVSELWFDMGSMSVEQSRDMRNLVHRLQPNCMIGSRIGNDMGDFMVMGDNQEPDYTIGVPWQSPASFFDETWGYRSWQKRVSEEEKVKEKLTSLIRVASRGGNFLLNIGPRGDGSVVEYERDVLLKIGAWLQQNSEAVYDTRPDPFHVSFNWGSITSQDNKLYLHVMQQPENNLITLPGVKTKAVKAYELNGAGNYTATLAKEAVTIELPASFSVADGYKVVVLDFPGGYTVPPANIIPVDKSIALNNDNAFKSFSNSGIDYNTRYTSTIKQSYTLLAAKNNSYTPALYYTEEEKGKSLELELGEHTETITLDNDAPLPLNNSTGTLQYGPLYLQGPLYSGLDGTHASLSNINVNAPWPKENGNAWQQKQDWKTGATYTLPAGLTTAYYVLQEINTAAAQPLLVRITSGDGLMVFLNGKQLFIQNNPFKKESVDHVLLLNLQAGNNQLAVKLFNNFHGQIPFAIDYNIPQHIYRKVLPVVQLQKNSYYPVSWRLHQPFTPHQDMGLPNLVFKLEK